MGEPRRDEPAVGSEPDWLDDGRPPLTAAERRRRRNILALLAAAVVLISAVSLLVNRNTAERAVSDPTPAPAPSSAPASPPSVSLTSRPPRGPVVVSNQGPFVRGLDGVLFARSADTVYRVELATGRVVATPGTEIASSGPTAFIAGDSQVIIRPWDSVPGLLVPDDGRPRELTGLLREGMQALPGPPGQVWVSRDINSARAARMTLIRLSNGTVASSVSGAGSFESDGRGGLLLSDVGGVWEASASRLRRITTGVVAAVGAHHYLVVNCDAAHRCTSSLYDRTTRTRRTLGPIDTSAVPQGAISPDGKYVALIKTTAQGNARVDLTDLSTGATIATQPLSTESLYAVSNMLIWSPDSHYLFAIRDGGLMLINSRTGQTTTPDLPLHEILQLTLRPER